MKSKLKFIIPILLLVVAGAAYKFVLAKPAKAEPPKIAGAVYVLPSEFLLNLADGKYAKLKVGLIMKPGAETEAAAGGHGGGAEPPEGYGTLPQEAVVRDIITNAVTEVGGRELTSDKGRDKLKEEILQRIHKQTDVEAQSVLFTDVTVQ
jgi:flagellar basal body-associated protein FliL